MFIVQVIHPFDAQADGELSLAVGDYVVVRQVRLIFNNQDSIKL